MPHMDPVFLALFIKRFSFLSVHMDPVFLALFIKRFYFPWCTFLTSVVNIQVAVAM